MGYVIILGRLVLFMISNLGIWEFFRSKLKLSIFFVPAFTISLQISILFMAGLLNCLKIVTLIIFILGFFLALYYLFKSFKSIVKVYFNVGYIFFAFMFGLILIACKGCVFAHFDNFSHWALVVKTMLLTNRYPSFQDPVILFQAYPLGSATYIYYFAQFVGKSEGIQMCAQSFMMLCFVLPVFKYVKKNKIVSGVYTVLFVNYLLCYNVAITQLLVDTVLPLQGMAMLVFIYSECINWKEEGARKNSILCAIPFLITAIQIKNSGIFFVAVACLLIIISLKFDKKEMKQKIVTMFTPFMSLYLWHTHCSYVFVSALSTKNAMTVQNYKNAFFMKTADELKTIVTGILKVSFSFETAKEFYFLLFYFVILGLLSLIISVEIKRKFLKLVRISMVLYVTYMMGVMFTYFFSMGGYEATSLAGFDRYRKTIFIAILYLLMIFSLEMISEIQNNWKKWMCLFICFGALIFNWGKLRAFQTILTISKSVPEMRIWLEQEINDYNIPIGASCMICVPPSSDGGYAAYICRYLLNSDKVSGQLISEKSQFENVDDYEYIFIFDEDNAIIQQWVKTNYPTQIGNKVIDTNDKN